MGARIERIGSKRKGKWGGEGSGGDRRKGAMVFCVRTRQLSLGAYFSRGIVSQFHLIASSMEGQQIGDIRVKMLKRKGGGEGGGGMGSLSLNNNLNKSVKFIFHLAFRKFRNWAETPLKLN